MDNHRQIPLNIRLDHEATFANFFISDHSSNGQVVAALRSLCLDPAGHTDNERFLYLWGNSGAGISHLLQAACHEVHELGRLAQYLPLTDMGSVDPVGLLESLEAVDLLCLDDVKSVVGHPEWDSALFVLFNRMREHHKGLVMAASCSPRELKSSLPDLSSRLSWGLTCRLEVLSDRDKPLALQKRAALRGLDLSDEVVVFLLRHGNREPQALFACLDVLDRRSLVEKRRVSIPFVKEIMGW